MAARLVVCRLRVVPAVVLAFSLTGIAFASPSNKWRLQCSGGADSDGVIVFQIVPKGGSARIVEVSIAKGTGENAVARRIRDVFEATLPKEGFHVEVDDGEDVLVKKRGRTPNFDLIVQSNSVEGVRINPDKE
jgi:hypothetical protein